MLLRHGLSQADATLSTRLFTETTCDGVYSHGLGRFPSYNRTIEDGYIKPVAVCRRVAGTGTIERWDRAVDLALNHGVGLVALANTNHWMRAGTYGRQAADRGALAMLWTNTTASLPSWGGNRPGLGNSPMVLAVPRKYRSTLRAPSVPSVYRDLPRSVGGRPRHQHRRYGRRDNRLREEPGGRRRGSLPRGTGAQGSGRKQVPRNPPG